MINCTPHPITIRRSDGEEVTLPPSGTVARVSTTEEIVGEAMGVQVIRRNFGVVTGLPRDEQGRVQPCIVSSIVLSALPAGTPNVYAPDTGSTAVRDASGQIIAVTRLVAA